MGTFLLPSVTSPTASSVSGVFLSSGCSTYQSPQNAACMKLAHVNYKGIGLGIQVSIRVRTTKFNNCSRKTWRVFRMHLSSRLAEPPSSQPRLASESKTISPELVESLERQVMRDEELEAGVSGMPTGLNSLTHKEVGEASSESRAYLVSEERKSNGFVSSTLTSGAEGMDGSTTLVDARLTDFKAEAKKEASGGAASVPGTRKFDQEEPWFRKAQAGNVQVSVAPGGRWSNFKTYSTVQRTFEIWMFAFTLALRVWLINRKFMYPGKEGFTDAARGQRRRALAKWLKEGLLRLGPTFIKIGQQFSTRVDVLAKEYVDELAELQDQVPPFDSDTAVAILEEELGAPVKDIFERFDREPIAAASLGQVHRARLNGEEVVVKIQRPGLKALFDIDLKNLRVIAQNLQNIDPKSDGAKRDWVAIYDECASILYQEIDYEQEGRNADRFRENFKDMEYVKVPKVIWEFTTPRVLTMEYTPGIKINRILALDELGIDKQRLARYTVESYLEQILRHGFFHADPHPGNIAVDNVGGGRLIFYDFGMMGSISSDIREGLLEAFYGVYERDPDKVIAAMVQMGVLVPSGDLVAVRRTAQFFLNSLEERLEAQKAEKAMNSGSALGFKKQLTKEEKATKKKQRLAAIGEDLLSLSTDQPFRFPATFTFVVRAFSVLDGIGKGLDPRFDISEIARPYALEILRFREAGIEFFMKDLRKRWERQSRAFANLFQSPTRVAKLESIVTRLEQGDLKLRVRTLESERAFKRVALMQATIGRAMLAGILINLATTTYTSSLRVPSIAAYIGSAIFGLQVVVGLLKVKKLDEQEKLILGTA